MEVRGGMEFYTFEEILDEDLGPIGTPERDAFEAMVEAGLEEEKQKRQHACKADKAARKKQRAQHPAQEQFDFGPIGKVALR